MIFCSLGFTVLFVFCLVHLTPDGFYLDCEQSLFGQSRLSSAGLERANSRERGKCDCEASESRGEAGEKAGKEGGTAFSFVTDAFKFLRRPSIGKLDWLINNRMLSARCHCNL